MPVASCVATGTALAGRLSVAPFPPRPQPLPGALYHADETALRHGGFPLLMAVVKWKKGPPFGRALLSMPVASCVATGTALRAAFWSLPFPPRPPTPPQTRVIASLFWRRGTQAFLLRQQPRHAQRGELIPRRAGDPARMQGRSRYPSKEKRKPTQGPLRQHRAVDAVGFCAA